MNTLAFSYILPTTGRIPDFHRLETCAAGRTEKGAAACQQSRPVRFLMDWEVLESNLSMKKAP